MVLGSLTITTEELKLHYLQRWPSFIKMNTQCQTMTIAFKFKREFPYYEICEKVAQVVSNFLQTSLSSSTASTKPVWVLEISVQTVCTNRDPSTQWANVYTCQAENQARRVGTGRLDECWRNLYVSKMWKHKEQSMVMGSTNDSWTALWLEWCQESQDWVCLGTRMPTTNLTVLYKLYKWWMRPW